MTTPTYTPEQLRGVIKSIGTMTIDEVIRAHAAALADLAARDAELAAMKQGKALADGMANMIRGFILKTVERETLDESAAKYRKWEEDYCHSDFTKLNRDEWKRKAEDNAGDAGRWNRLCDLWAASTVMALTQEPDGTWAIIQVEEANNEVFAKLVGADPDSTIDAAIEKARDA